MTGSSPGILGGQLGEGLDNGGSRDSDGWLWLLSCITSLRDVEMQAVLVSLWCDCV